MTSAAIFAGAHARQLQVSLDDLLFENSFMPLSPPFWQQVGRRNKILSLLFKAWLSASLFLLGEQANYHRSPRWIDFGL
jgi:hypothetical protein